MEPRPKALTFQEEAVRWLPGPPHAWWPPYVWWSAICLAMVLILLAVLNPSLSIIPAADVRFRLKLAILVSCLATVYEIVGIIWGCNRCEALAGRLTEIFKFTPERADDWRDQNLRPAWRCSRVLLLGLAVAGFAWLVIFFFVARLIFGSVLSAFLFSMWFAFGGFWCGAAMYHIFAISFAIYKLSRQPLKIAFGHPTSLGISEVGRLALKYFFVYAVAAMLWISTFLALPMLIKNDLWVAGVGATMIGLVLFAVPQFSIHFAMLKKKREKLADVLDAIELKFNYVVKGQGEPEPKKELKDLMEFYQFMLRLPTWPFDAAAISKLVPTAALPVLPQVSLEILRVFPNLWRMIP